ncbi:MAG TPA: acylphosphatase [Acidiphilium sp.]|nr:MAG: acylphosphatase [Acidiphilium sp. 21-60-14]OYV92088.1 MAG: acylphosphatase [Acidiphilium sp. 37-60-79]OZB40224.1 MAG: acylphosphatase [Acidiphilium sp. 34-60-192]HQT88429.1 acylphosphatase [Acidiphilium sp.]HQU23254.1 acylphosphatase [Acidiphilium sp.]
MISKSLIIAGHVQGVGFRDWIIRRARRQGIVGWVRNRRDGTLEALIAGEADAVEELLRACRRGPPGAEVQSITEHFADPPTEPGFTKRPTA